MDSKINYKKAAFKLLKINSSVPDYKT